MTERISPQPYARICGALYLYIIVAGIFAEVFVRSRLIVPADAAATATNIIANEQLFRIGFSGELLHLAFDVAVAALLYALLRPVNRIVALLAAFMRLVSDIILAAVSVSHFATLRLLADADYLKTFQPEQLQALALLALKLHGDGYNICLFFFGFACLALGYLIFRSGYLPRAIGALLALAGACYLLNSLGHFLAPPFAARLFPALFVPVFVAELSLSLWLLFKGVDAAKWDARTSARS
ncbi:MAG TPA: DUF4386 domain-containing protein [Steroidobacteraceae bacterium]|nr:DUF4386 domain-containing protein [Steroidobacteraceae bacterium]